MSEPTTNLVLTRKIGERVVISHGTPRQIVLEVLEVRRGVVRLKIVCDETTTVQTLTTKESS